MTALNNNTFSIDESATKKIDNFFGSFIPKNKVESIDVLRTTRLNELEQSGQTLFAIGERARLGFWKVMIETYTERFFLFSVQGLSDYINSFSKYLQEKYGIPKSSAAADTKVIKMLETGSRREVLDKPIDKLNSYLRLFSTAAEKWHQKLLDDVENLVTYSSDDLKSYFKAVKAVDDDQWHLRLLDDIDRIAVISTDKIAKLGDKPKTADVDEQFKQTVNELIKEYVIDSTDTNDEQAKSDSEAAE